MWYLLSILLWTNSVCGGFLPRFKDKASLQVPIVDTPADATSARGAKVEPANAPLPVVDLGYTKHRATYNLNSDLYKFENIRYAAPPVGELRFKAPRPPLQGGSDEIEDGSGKRECLQGNINWAEYFPGDECESCECCEEEDAFGECKKTCSDDKTSQKPPKLQLGSLIPKFDLTDPRIFSEDCLYLDVWSPKDIFNDKAKRVPVFVWIYGGAYVFGGKSLYNPGGLMDRAMKNDRGGMIFVAMNYRMGALGFAAGKDIPDEDVNAGLLDQQAALKWVQEHIHKFGGDPEKVTVAGLSAGGGSALHHVTAYGGQKKPLFKRAISLSGGWQPITNKTRAESTFQKFMKDFNQVSTLDELRKVSESQMIQTNFKQINSAPPGTFLYNPTAWGDFAPESPTKLFESGKFAYNVEILLSNVVNEGGQFIKAFKDRGTTVPEFIELAFPDATDAEKQWIIETYETGYDDNADIEKIIGDATFRCHASYVTEARYRDLYRQIWNTMNSKGHGGDLLYLFYQPPLPVSSIRSARILQDYVVTFTITGEPTTIIRNPERYPQPVNYKKVSSDGRAQYFNTFLEFPDVVRGKIQAEEVCNVWQVLGFT